MRSGKRRHLLTTRRILAMLLAFALVFSYAPTQVRAAEVPEDGLYLLDESEAPGLLSAGDDTLGLETMEDGITPPDTEGGEILPQSDEIAADEDILPSEEFDEIPGEADELAEDDINDGYGTSKLLGTEPLGVTSGSYTIGIRADETVTCNNMGVSFTFYSGADGGGEALGEREEYVAIHPSEEGTDGHQYANEFSGDSYPEGTKSVIIRATTAGNTLVAEGSYMTLKVGSGDAQSVFTAATDNAALESGGFVINLPDTEDATILDVYLEYTSGGGGGEPQPGPAEGSMYRVLVDMGKYLPAGLNPGITIKFDTQEGGQSYSESTDWTDMPKIGEYAPAEVTVSVADDYQAYFQNGYIDEYRDGQYYTTLCDLFDVFRSGDTPYSYTFETEEGSSYCIRSIFSYSRSVGWRYTGDKDSDDYVEHCKLYLLDEDGNIRPYVDEAYEPDDPHYDTSELGYANYQLKIGESYKFKLVPDKGYQVSALGINGYEIEPSEVVGDVGIFNFTMQDFNFHMRGVVVEVGSIGREEATDIEAVTIDDKALDSISETAIDTQFDDTMGGSIMVSIWDADSFDYKGNDVTYGSDTAPEDKAAAADMVSATTIEMDIDQVVAKGAVTDEDTTFWEKDIYELEDTVKISFDFDGEEGKEYLVAREHDGIVDILPATYENGKLSFASDKFSRFTVLKEKSELDKVVFDLMPEDMESSDYVLAPVSGLDAVTTTEDAYDYTYSGSGDIKILITKNDEPIPDEELAYFANGFMYKFGLIFDAGDDEEWGFFAEKLDGGVMITVPAYDGSQENPYVIKAIMTDAMTVAPDNPVVGIKVKDGLYYGPGPQVDVDPDSKAIVKFDIEDAEHNNISNVTEWNEEGGNYRFIDEDVDYIYFDVLPDLEKVKAPAEISSVTYRVQTCENNIGELEKNIAQRFPLRQAEYDEDKNCYRIPVIGDHDPQISYGVIIYASVTENTDVTVDFGNTWGSLFADNEGDLLAEYDISARVGSQEYPLDLDRAETRVRFNTTVPRGEDVVIRVTPTTGRNTVSVATFESELEDGTKSGPKTIAASKTGEYTLATKGAKSVTLGVASVPAPALAIFDMSGTEILPVKGKYTLNCNDEFTAYVRNGTSKSEGDNEIKDLVEEASFYNGKEAITGAAGVVVESTIITATGKSLGMAGKTMSLKAVSKSGNTYTASITFSSDITSVKVAGADKNNVITVPYGTDKAMKVTLSKGADSESLRFTCKEDDAAREIIDFDTEKSTLTIDALKVMQFCDPGDELTLAFSDGAAGKAVGTPFIIKLSDPLTGADGIRKIPSLSNNTKIATNQKLGLTLSMPKGVSATSHMFYVVKARAQLGEDPVTVVDYKGKEHYAILGYEDIDERGRRIFIDVYDEEVMEVIPATTKNYELDVADAPRAAEDGWIMGYDVSVQLVYGYYDEESSFVPIPDNDPAFYGPIDAFTKDNAYETKLALTKKAPSRIYTGQTGVSLAIPKWNATTTVKSLDRVVLNNSYGNEIAVWDRNGFVNDDSGARLTVEHDQLITLDTCVNRPTEEDDDNLLVMAPGKYTLVAYAVGGPGKQAMASMAFTVSEGIWSMDVMAPDKVLKPYNKKTTFKATVNYSGLDGSAPANKKVTWEIIKKYNPDNDEELSINGTPLEGKVTVKNGTVTVAAGLNVSNVPDDNCFVVKVTAADYEGNPTVAYSAPVTLISQAQIPTTIMLGWWDENGDGTVSEVNEENIKAGQKFITQSVNNAGVRVLDQYGNDMDATIAVTGLSYDPYYNRLTVNKPGKMSVKATAKDGGKKSKTLSFTTVYCNGDYKLNVLIQDVRAEMDPQNGFSFINIDPDIVFNSETNEPDYRQEGLTSAVNTYSALSPIYVNVAGVRSGYIEPDGTKHEEVDYGQSTTISHAVKVDGGKILATTYGVLDNYTTYKIQPTKKTTKITVTDKTVDSAWGRVKQNAVYTVTNECMSEAKAFTISPDKKSIYNTLKMDTGFIDIESNPNRVNYTVKNSAKKAPEASDGKFLYAWVTIEGGKNYGQANLARYMSMFDEYGYASGVYYKMDAQGKFVVDFFDVVDGDDASFYVFDEMPAGTYNFNVTIGESPTEYADMDEGVEGFEPLAAMSKITLKVVAPPKSSGKFKTTRYKLAASEEESGYLASAELDIATVKNSYGVVNRINRVAVGENDFLYNGDAYRTVSMNSKGVTNSFSELFTVDNPYREIGVDSEATILKAGENPAIAIVKNEGTTDWLNIYIEIDKKTLVYIQNWSELAHLSNGTFKATQDNGIWKYNEDADSMPTTAAKQKTAYNKWAKANLTGYIEYRALDYSGRENLLYQQITVDISGFLASLIG